jgi:hypothetical protein
LVVFGAGVLELEELEDEEEDDEDFDEDDSGDALDEPEFELVELELLEPELFTDADLALGVGSGLNGLLAWSLSFGEPLVVSAMALSELVVACETSMPAVATPGMTVLAVGALGVSELPPRTA